jgi:glycine oxidase
VIGAGVIGLVSGYELMRAGYNVTVIDSSPARGASWAAAGMLAPSAEVQPDEPDMLPVMSRSLSLWPQLSDTLGLTASIARLVSTWALSLSA